jgi:hypothetical protein
MYYRKPKINTLYTKMLEESIGPMQTAYIQFHYQQTGHPVTQNEQVMNKFAWKSPVEEFKIVCAKVIDNDIKIS